MGIEPTAQAWEAWVLPLYDARLRAILVALRLHKQIAPPVLRSLCSVAAPWEHRSQFSRGNRAHRRGSQNEKAHAFGVGL